MRKKGTEAKLTPRERKTVDHYFTNGFRKAEAMRSAGYGGKGGLSPYEFFQRGLVVAEIERRHKAARVKYESDEELCMAVLRRKILGDETLARFKHVGDDGQLYWDFSGATQEDLACVSELQTETYMDGRGDDAREVKRTKIKASDPAAYLSLMMRKLGLLQDSIKLAADQSLIEILQQRGRQVAPEKA